LKGYEDPEDLEDEPKRFQNSKNSEDCGLANGSSEEHKVRTGDPEIKRKNHSLSAKR
jgi:hypothetical protein